MVQGKMNPILSNPDFQHIVPLPFSFAWQPRNGGRGGGLLGSAGANGGAAEKLQVHLLADPAAGRALGRQQQRCWGCTRHQAAHLQARKQAALRRAQAVAAPARSCRAGPAGGCGCWPPAGPGICRGGGAPQLEMAGSTPPAATARVKRHWGRPAPGPPPSGREPPSPGAPGQQLLREVVREEELPARAGTPHKRLGDEAPGDLREAWGVQLSPVAPPAKCCGSGTSLLCRAARRSGQQGRRRQAGLAPSAAAVAQQDGWPGAGCEWAGGFQRRRAPDALAPASGPAPSPSPPGLGAAPGGAVTRRFRPAGRHRACLPRAPRGRPSGGPSAPTLRASSRSLRRKRATICLLPLGGTEHRKAAPASRRGRRWRRVAQGSWRMARRCCRTPAPRRNVPSRQAPQDDNPPHGRRRPQHTGGGPPRPPSGRPAAARRGRGGLPLLLLLLLRRGARSHP
jgi:hypothetical protein